jgi:hypothetical protein
MHVSNMAVELPLDILLGPTFDGLDILTGAGEYEANEKAFELWCLLLDHGYRLAATASSDACFDRPGGAVPGSVRIYSFLPGKFSLAKAARAAAAGRTFATTGPLLIATIDNEPPGAVFPAGPKTHHINLEAWASGSDLGGLQRLDILRNGRPCRQFLLPENSESFRTNIPVQETKDAWYCVRAFGSDDRRQIAVSGAFYFVTEAAHPPLPVPACVHALILDNRSGQPLAATLTEVNFDGTIAREGKRHILSNGESRLTVPGTVRLRGEAKGYAALTLSPFLDNPDLVQTVTGLTDADLLNWDTFEDLKERLGKVELVFRLRKAGQ